MKQLIINADDYGWSKGVVDAIIEGYQKGLFTSTTVMTTMPAFEYGVEKLKENPGLKAGVHLSLFDGNPVSHPSQVPSLIDQETGQFLSLEDVRKKPGKINHREVAFEFKAQVEMFLAYGLKPTHLDNHCDLVYRKTKWFQAVLSLAKQYQLPIRSPVGNDFDEKVPDLARIAKVPQFLVRFLGKKMRRTIDKAGVSRPDYFIEDYTFGDRSLALLEKTLSELKPGLSEILTHPGYGEDWREQEIRTWLDPKISQILKETPDLALVDFSILHQN